MNHRCPRPPDRRLFYDRNSARKPRVLDWESKKPLRRLWGLLSVCIFRYPFRTTIIITTLCCEYLFQICLVPEIFIKWFRYWWFSGWIFCHLAIGYFVLILHKWWNIFDTFVSLKSCCLYNEHLNSSTLYWSNYCFRRISFLFCEQDPQLHWFSLLPLFMWSYLAVEWILVELISGSYD